MLFVDVSIIFQQQKVDHQTDPTTIGYRIVQSISMYGIYANIGGILMVNVAIYSIKDKF